MPNRLIRDDILESERVLSLPAEGRWFFIAVLLSADDIGIFEATPFRLARKADVRRDHADKYLAMLADADLVRLYVANGKHYGFIPRYRQRLQIRHGKHPLPPIALIGDDEDAAKKIKHLTPNPTVNHGESPKTTDGQPPEAEAEAEKSVSHGSSIRARRQKPADRVPPCPYPEIVQAYHELLPGLPRAKLLHDKRKRAIRERWAWVLTSVKSDQTRRATNKDEGLAWFRGYFERAAANDFVTGRSGRSPGHENWEADIDYLMSDRGLKQVVEKTRAPA